MALERSVNPGEALCRNALPYDSFAAEVSDPVDDQAPQGGSGRSHDHIEEKVMAIVVDVAGDRKVDRHAQKRTIHSSDCEDPPRTQGAQHSPDPGGVALEDVFDG